jgi:hypothetical protein
MIRPAWESPRFRLFGTRSRAGPHQTSVLIATGCCILPAGIFRAKPCPELAPPIPRMPLSVSLVRWPHADGAI